MSFLGQLSPAPIWSYFEEICKIPRLSKNEGQIRRHLIDFAFRNSLSCKEDNVGNILIIRPASEGFEDRKTIVLQSHMDMVGEKNADYSHNWESDPIIPYIKDGWVCAKGTTLGADDGIGIASQMAILTDKTLKTGKIECLFTVDEESGMTGAVNLKPGFFSGNTLINLDSEDEGVLYIGCAGGMDTLGTMKYIPITVEKDLSAFELSVTGLHGGHSGDEIHKGYGSSVKIMNRLLRLLSDKFGVQLNKFDGGNLRNAIPREAFATILVKKALSNNCQQYIKDLSLIIKNELGQIEPDLKITLKTVSIPASSMRTEDQAKLLKAIEDCPHGVINWSKDMDDLVETSTNLASVKFLSDNRISIITTQRSSIEKSKNEIASRVESSLRIACDEVVHSDGYPGWMPNLSSEILKITRSCFLMQYGHEPSIRAMHAGLECGLIYEKNKTIDMISFGPSIRGAHTPEEMINIESTGMFWDLLLNVINSIPDNSNS